MTTYTFETITAEQARAFSTGDVLTFSRSGATAGNYSAYYSYNGLQPPTLNLSGPGASLTFGSGLFGRSIEFGDGSKLFLGDPGASEAVTGGPAGDAFFTGKNWSSFHGDVLSGGAGNDTLVAQEYGHQLNGDAGDDSLSSDSGGALAGGDGADTISGAESASGGAGNDRIEGVGSLYGDAGDDYLDLTGNYGNTRALGGDGNDTIRASSSDALLDGGAGDDRIAPGTRSQSHGGDGADYIGGGSRGLVAYGEAGNDTLSGSDSMYGGDGNDSIQVSHVDLAVFGDAGNDTIFCFENAAPMILNGGAGDDMIISSLSAATVAGGAGSDTFVAYGGNPRALTITDWESIDKISTSGTPFGYLETSKGSASEAAAFAQSQFAAGVNYVVVAVGSDLHVYTHVANSTASDPVSRLLLLNRGLGDISESNFVGGPSTTTPVQPPTPTHQGAVSGNMDAQNIAILQGAEIDPSSTSLRLTKSGVTLTLKGTGFVYTPDDQLMGGTVTNISYTSADFAFNFQTSGVSASNFAYWTYYNQTVQAFSSILSGGDRLDGSSGADVIHSYDGDDVLTGGGGIDSLYGGSGNDDLNGGPGNDFLFGEAGADIFRASGGIDRIMDFNRAAGDRIVLGGGVTYTATQVGADVAVNLSDGSQIVLANLSMSSLTGDWITGATTGGSGSGGGGGGGGSPFGSLTPAAALSIKASDSLTFGTGTATLITVGYNPDGTIAVSMNGQSMTFGGAISDVSKAGHIAMPDGSKLFIGAGGSEAFTGAATGDAAFGGLGDDTLDGGSGGDLLQGNQGRDSLVGGEGSDTVYGGQDDDTLLMGSGGNFGQGNKGVDIVAGGEGVDTLLGGQDNDTVAGDAGNDFLNGNRGDDSISGGLGNDTLYGEGGNDTLAGGSGADVFHGFAGGGLDRVVDFSRAEGDRVVLDPGATYTTTQSGADVVVAYGAGDQIVLAGTSLASLTGDWIGV